MVKSLAASDKFRKGEQIEDTLPRGLIEQVVLFQLIISAFQVAPKD